MTELPLIPGAEPLSAAGSDVGVLVVHGFTGNPSTMRPLADALVAAGFTVEMPRLPGHGTTIEDMATTTWADWSGAAESAYLDLAGRCRSVVVAGLSMGGTLTAWLAARHPELAGIVCINPAVSPREPEVKEMVTLMLAAGETVSPGIGSDIADPDALENAYPGTPVGPLLSLFSGVADLTPRLDRIRCPVLIATSIDDHVVAPNNSDVLAACVTGPVERLTCHRSYHVVTLDYDKAEVIAATVEFAHKVTSSHRYRRGT